jgi:hypothetical protein
MGISHHEAMQHVFVQRVKEANMGVCFKQAPPVPLFLEKNVVG